MKNLRYLLLILSVLGLVGVRILEDDIFYDPFLNYFRDANAQESFPIFDWTKLILSHIFRFALNGFFSGLIVYFLFKNVLWTKEALFLILLIFALTLPLYLYCVSDQFQIGELISFYLRRFVIQPLGLLLIIPLFYYRKSQENR